MDVAVALGWGGKLGIVCTATDMAVVAMRVQSMRVVMGCMMVVVRDLVAPAAVRGDAQHAPRRHAGTDLREQEQRKHESGQDLHHGRSRDIGGSEGIAPKPTAVKQGCVPRCR